MECEWGWGGESKLHVDATGVFSGVCSLSAQSNFAVGAVVNATFGSITEITFYITALLRGHRAGTKCYEEIVKAALTGTLLGCILFIPVSGQTGARSCNVASRFFYVLHLCICTGDLHDHRRH